MLFAISLAISQFGSIALYHFGELDLFWLIVLELFWGIGALYGLLAWWVNDTWGAGT